MNIIIKYIVVFLVIITSPKLIAQHQLPEGAEEGLFNLKYSNFSVDISPIIYKDSVYIPLSDFFNLLKIYYEIQDQNIIQGYVFNRDSSFSINTSSYNCQSINNEYFRIDKDSYLKTSLETYLLPSVLDKIFNVIIYVKSNQLKIHITSDYKFPILVEYERNNKYNNIANLSDRIEDELPILYARNWKLIDGGLLDYYLSGSQSGSRQMYGFGGNIGFQFLGGEMQYNLNSSYDLDYNKLNKKDNYRWKYNFSENKYVSQLAFGSIYNTQSRSSSILNVQNSNRSLNGIQLSNESICMPSAFSTFTIQDRIEPNWQVELYVADQLFAQTVSDNLGYYQFELPINYGNTNIEVKIYGPHGEFISNKDVISIPNEILTPGDIKYNFSAGQDIFNNKYYGNGLLTIGLTDWFTNSVYFEKEYDSFGHTLVNNSSIRLMNSILLNTSISPENYYKAGIRFLINNMGAYDFIYSRNNINSKLDNENQSIMISGSLPRLFNLPINISFRGAHTESQQLSTSTLNASLSLNLSQFYISSRYYASFNRDKSKISEQLNHNVNFQIDYSWYKKSNSLSFLGNTRFSINSAYIFNSNQFTSAGFTISQEIAKIANIILSNNYNTISNNFTSNLTIMLNTSLFRMNSTMQSSPDYNNSFSENINGSINFDSDRGKVYFSNTGSFNSSSSSGASIRFYIDNNGNGLFDKEDQIVEGGAVYVPGATVEKENNGIKRVLNLLPGGRYNLYVKPSSFKNPNVLPKITEFSFVTDPNTIKSIDIPCFVGGVVEGSVSRIDTNGEKITQSGVKVHIKSKNNPESHTIMPVFSDGSFYKIGLMPDSYIAYLDSMQLNLLNSVSNPPTLEFTIKTSNEGDYVGDLNFTLSDNDSIIKIKKELQRKIERKAAEQVAIKQHLEKQTKSVSEIILNKKNTALGFDTLNLKNLEEIKVIDEFKGENIDVEARDLTKEKIELPNEKDPIVPGKLRSLMFAKSRTTYLNQQMKNYLDKVADYMIANPRAILNIAGHSDNFGSLEENFKVSNKRAKEVFNYLVLKGIDKYRLRYTAHGPLQPRGDYKTEKGRAQNMRVELNLQTGN